MSINDELLREAKELAARRQSNVSAIVNEALRSALKLESTSAKERKYETLVYSPRGGKTHAKHISPAEMKEMLVAEETVPYTQR